MPYIGRNAAGRICHESSESRPGLSDEFIEENAPELLQWRNVSPGQGHDDDREIAKTRTQKIEDRLNKLETGGP